MLVDGAGAQRRPDIIATNSSRRSSTCAEEARWQAPSCARFQIFLLADIADDGDDFAAVIFLEPRDE